jgi:tRNA threonylcarbamoyladenosine biosynthesis protein TsaB
MIAQVLDQAGIGPRDLAGVAVATGPATYTGLRIGLATARAMGLALGIPVWGVGDLDVLAHDAAGGLGLETGATVLATGDARRREVFWALYRVAPEGLELVDGPGVGAPSTAPAATVRVGTGAALYPDVLPPTPGTPASANPVTLVNLAWRRAAAKVPCPAEPIYLRRPDVSPPGKAKRAGLTPPGQAGRARN